MEGVLVVDTSIPSRKKVYQAQNPTELEVDKSEAGTADSGAETTHDRIPDLVKTS